MNITERLFQRLGIEGLAACEVGLTAGWQLCRQRTQGGAETFLQDWMIERKSQHVVHRQGTVDSQGQ